MQHHTPFLHCTSSVSRFALMKRLFCSRNECGKAGNFISCNTHRILSILCTQRIGCLSRDAHIALHILVISSPLKTHRTRCSQLLRRLDVNKRASTARRQMSVTVAAFLLHHRRTPACITVLRLHRLC